jgi:radical SAM superfamily enzyme YgiQ (UPF0313 family)
LSSVLTKHRVTSPKVLVLEPPNQGLPIDIARSNGSLGPCYLVGALRHHGFEADYLDGTVGSDPDELDRTFLRAIPQENGLVRYGMSEADLAEVISQYDVVAASSIFTAQTRMHFDIARIVQQVSSGSGRRIYLIAGGVNARALRRHFLTNGFDAVALGDGEQVIVDLSKQLALGAIDVRTLDGVAFLENDEVVDRPVAKDVSSNLDHLPMPAWEALPFDCYRRLAEQLGVGFGGTIQSTQMQTSRGCQDACTFCHISLEKEQHALLGRIGFLREFSKWRVRELAERARDLACRRMYLVDENLFYNKKRLRDLAPFLRVNGLEYSDTTGANLRFLLRRDGRGEYVVDSEFIDVLVEFGLTELGLPFETANADLMRRYASGKYDPELGRPIEIVRALKAAGITTRGEFMIGFADETWDSMVQTKRYAQQLCEEGMDNAGFQISTPYPGSVDFERVMADSSLRDAFDANPLHYTDRMHTRGRPVFPTKVEPERLEAAVHEFWLEVNRPSFVAGKAPVTLARLANALGQQSV